MDNEYYNDNKFNLLYIQIVRLISLHVNVINYVTISTKYLNVTKQYVGNFGKKNIGEWAIGLSRLCWHNFKHNEGWKA